MADRQFALTRDAELDSSVDSGRRTSISSAGSSDLERLHEELELEIKPQKLQRQYTLSVPPSSGSITRSGLLDASPGVPEDVLDRWEKNQVKWRRLAASGEELKEAIGEDDAVDASLSPEDAGELFVDIPRTETFDVTFGDGFLGLEFVFDVVKNQVLIKNVLSDSGSNAVMQIPPGMNVVRGLAVDAVNGQDASAMAPEDVLDALQFSKRPMTVRFQKAATSVVCKLCETKVDANSLDEHTNFCVLSKRVELEADVINNSLVNLTASITANLETEAMKPMFSQEEMHIYHALRVAAIQASTCDVTSVDSFALCSRLVKIIDRIREQEEDSANYAIERGISYCTKLRNLIHMKMSKMRASHKVMLQQNPVEIVCAPFKRTKSLEELEASSGVKTPRRRGSLKPSSYRVSIRDFQIIKPISKGAFGKVYLARKKTTGDQYAIKVLAKEHLLRKKQIQQIETERNILASVVSPFVVKLFWTFQTKRNLFLVMEYLPGGDFMSLLECIVQLEEQILWPDGEKCLSLEAMDLIDKLLDPDPATRMGWDDIQLHPFFVGINWDTILESVPPFVPTLEGPNDTSYFNNRNLTDIFIDDDEFDVNSRSASSSQNNFDSGPESDESLPNPFEVKGGQDGDAGENNTDSNTEATDVGMSWGLAGALNALSAAPQASEEYMGDELQVGDNNSHHRFPSGMYGSTEDSSLSDAFRSFSFTNMNALAAASQAEAEMIADTQAVDSASGPSILI
ncbi:hypothetical protein PHYBOEH_003221 [Phytophthora boehmeriae]|uniref:non-specific serine/threonine protein kinase n=1 Tax=Phytophthora boehmeriae TaxID=109152 RepID=A0A8T1X5J1_9STRA|nr:hypothetical protein PHYBOEH_003221 [Phytophthora boehmeriae]